MANRTFERRSSWTGSGPDRDARQGTKYVVLCSECGSEGAMHINKIAGSVPPDMIGKHFTAKGWLLGRSASHDICPSCLEIKASERRKRNAEKEANKVRAERAYEKAAQQGQPEPLNVKLPSTLSETDRATAQRLLEKFDALRYEQTFLQGSILALVDRSADLEREISDFLPVMETIAGLEGIDLSERLRRYEEQEKAMSFEKLPTGRIGRARIAGRVVRIGWSKPAGGGPATARLTISADLAKELGFRPDQGDRVMFYMGTGVDAGKVLVERGKEGAFVTVRTTGTAHITTGAIRPVDKAITVIPSQKIGFSVVEGKLVIRLPDEFVNIGSVTRAMEGAARAGL